MPSRPPPPGSRPQPHQAPVSTISSADSRVNSRNPFKTDAPACYASRNVASAADNNGSDTGGANSPIGAPQSRNENHELKTLNSARHQQHNTVNSSSNNSNNSSNNSNNSSNNRAMPPIYAPTSNNFQVANNTYSYNYGNSNSNNYHQETISVKLDHSTYYQRQRQVLCQKLIEAKERMQAVLGGQPATAANNNSDRQNQEAQNSQEKYTMDMVNELRGDHEQFNWKGDEAREMWESKLQYFLAVTSYSIGLGNVWRFPMLVQKNGGAAFIIPFVIMLIVEGIPLFYLELAIGQRIRKAAVSCWNLVSPFAAGLGIASAIVSFNIGLYYNTIVAWCIYYLWSSLKSPLPFTHCPSRGNSSVDDNTPALNQFTARPASAHRDYTIECQNSSPTQYYWYRETLDTSDDVERWTGLNYHMALCLAISWFTSYICLVKGLSSAKKIVYITSTFPYVILTIFFVKAMSLDGMSDGVYHLFAPNWSKLADPHVWLQSAAQVFYSLGLGFGGLIALSSYNPVNNNCYKDAVTVSIINSLTSLYAGVVIFAVLGFKANIMYDKCVANRELMIDFYLGDHNLKVIDYGSVFSHPSITDDGSVTDYYDLNDALNAIQSLDQQLDSQRTEDDIDYGDSDIEFMVDAGNMISSENLKSIIDSIPNLPQCDLKKELDRSASGTGLAFIVFTEAINQFPNANLWSIMFFLMLLTLGLDSQFGTLEGLLSSIADLKLSPKMNREYATGLICGVSFCISLIMFAHGSGNYMFSIFDQFAGNFPLVVIALFELLAVSYIYGLKRFNDDCELMTGKRPPLFILLCWRYFAPITLIIILISSFSELDTSLYYQAWIASKASLETKAWPTWCLVLGFVLVVSSIIWIPLVAMLRVFKVNLIAAENFSLCWFPAEELREYYNIQEETKVTPLERILLGFRSEDDY